MYVAMAGLGKTPVALKSSGNTTPMTPEQQATTGTLSVCGAAARSGAYVHNGKPAVIGTPEFNDCLSVVTPILAAGQGRDVALQAAIDHGTQRQVQEASATGPNWLLWGAVGAGVLIIGAVVLTKK